MWYWTNFGIERCIMLCYWEMRWNLNKFLWSMLHESLWDNSMKWDPWSSTQSFKGLNTDTHDPNVKIQFLDMFSQWAWSEDRNSVSTWFEICSSSPGWETKPDLQKAIGSLLVRSYPQWVILAECATWMCHIACWQVQTLNQPLPHTNV